MSRLRIGIAIAVIVVVVALLALMAPYLPLWDPTGEELVSRADPVPENAIGDFVPPEGGGAFDDGSTHAYPTYVSETYFDRAWSTHRLTLAFVEGHATGAEYSSSSVAITEARYRLPMDGMHYQRVIASCTGSASFDGIAWTLAFVDAACAPASGRYERWTEPAAPAREPTGPEAAPWPGACAAYADCACALAAGNAEVFGPGCSEAQALVASGVDSPGECAGGLTMMRSLAASLGLSLPARCAGP